MVQYGGMSESFSFLVYGLPSERELRPNRVFSFLQLRITDGFFSNSRQLFIQRFLRLRHGRLAIQNQNRKKQVRLFPEVAARVSLNGQLFVVNQRLINARAFTM